MDLYVREIMYGARWNGTSKKKCNGQSRSRQHCLRKTHIQSPARNEFFGFGGLLEMGYAVEATRP